MWATLDEKVRAFGGYRRLLIARWVTDVGFSEQSRVESALGDYKDPMFGYRLATECSFLMFIRLQERVVAFGFYSSQATRKNVGFNGWRPGSWESLNLQPLIPLQEMKTALMNISPAASAENRSSDVVFDPAIFSVEIHAQIDPRGSMLDPREGHGQLWHGTFFVMSHGDNIMQPGVERAAVQLEWFDLGGRLEPGLRHKSYSEHKRPEGTYGTVHCDTPQYPGWGFEWEAVNSDALGKEAQKALT